MWNIQYLRREASSITDYLLLAWSAVFANFGFTFYIYFCHLFTSTFTTFEPKLLEHGKDKHQQIASNKHTKQIPKDEMWLLYYLGSIGQFTLFNVQRYIVSIQQAITNCQFIDSSNDYTERCFLGKGIITYQCIWKINVQTVAVVWEEEGKYYALVLFLLDTNARKELSIVSVLKLASHRCCVKCIEQWHFYFQRKHKISWVKCHFKVHRLFPSFQIFYCCVNIDSENKLLSRNCPERMLLIPSFQINGMSQFTCTFVLPIFVLDTEMKLSSLIAFI